jgi:hypothetical protein
MDPITLGVIATTVAGLFTTVGGGIGVLIKSIFDNANGIRKNNLDQLQLAIAQVASLQLKYEADNVKIAELQKLVMDLTVANVRLSIESERLKADVIELQRQLGLVGQSPIVSSPTLIPVSSSMDHVAIPS